MPSPGWLDVAKVSSARVVSIILSTAAQSKTTISILLSTAAISMWRAGGPLHYAYITTYIV